MAGDADSPGRQFAASFQSTYGHPPSTEAIFGYEAMAALLSVIQGAGASGNHNPIHVDLDFARMLTRWVPQKQIRTYGVRFAAVTPLGAKPTCTGTIASI